MAIHGPSLKLWTDSDTLAVAQEVDAQFPRRDWTSTYPGHGEDGAAYAIDYMCNKSDGDKIAAYVWKNRVRLGVRYVVWNGKIISVSRIREGWRRYYPSPRAILKSPASAFHRNHVHQSTVPGFKYVSNEPLAPNERRQPTTRIIYLDRLEPGVNDSDSVWWMQKCLNKVLPGTPLLLTGDYGPVTQKCVQDFQKMLGDDIDPKGDIGPLQTRALVKQAGYDIKIEDKA